MTKRIKLTIKLTMRHNSDPQRIEYYSIEVLKDGETPEEFLSRQWWGKDCTVVAAEELPASHTRVADPSAQRDADHIPKAQADSTPYDPFDGFRVSKGEIEGNH